MGRSTGAVQAEAVGEKKLHALSVMIIRLKRKSTYDAIVLNTASMSGLRIIVGDHKRLKSRVTVGYTICEAFHFA